MTHFWATPVHTLEEPWGFLRAHAHMHARTHPFGQGCARTYAHIDTLTHLHRHVHAQPHRCTLGQAHARTYTNTFGQARARTNTQTFGQAHVHTHTNIHTHKHIDLITHQNQMLTRAHTHTHK